LYTANFPPPFLAAAFIAAISAGLTYPIRDHGRQPHPLPEDTVRCRWEEIGKRLVVCPVQPRIREWRWDHHLRQFTVLSEDKHADGGQRSRRYGGHGGHDEPRARPLRRRPADKRPRLCSNEVPERFLRWRVGICTRLHSAASQGWQTDRLLRRPSVCFSHLIQTCSEVLYTIDYPGARHGFLGMDAFAGSAIPRRA